MQHVSSHTSFRAAQRALILSVCRLWRYVALLMLMVLRPGLGLAQGPAWQLAQAGNPMQAGGSGTSTTTGTAVDASGNVFVTGYFSGQVAFGTTMLTSAGGTDVFVAKWMPATNSWAWAQSGGGQYDDKGNGIAVSGTNVYLTGAINEFYYSSGYGTMPSSPQASFGGISVYSSANSYSYGSTHSSFYGTDYLYHNMVVACYTDNGTSATVKWVQSSSASQGGKGIAVNGNAVYVIGRQVLPYTSTSEHCQAFRGCHTDYYYGSQSNIILFRYNDMGTAGNYAWAQTAGGSGRDEGYGVAASGSSVYITGIISNNAADASAVRFGTTAVPGASATGSSDMVVARYTDAGVFGWARVGGGTGEDIGQGITVNGANVYVTGSIYNNAADAHVVRFNGTAVAGASATASADVLLARYTDAGAFGWARAGGGTGEDRGLGVVANSTAAYLTGYTTNTVANANTVRFNAVNVVGASTTLSKDLLVARYANSGTFSWARTGGGAGADEGGGIAVSGTSLSVGGYTASASAAFGTATGSPLMGGREATNRAVVGNLLDATASGSWQTIKGSSHGGTSTTTGTAVDASGNVFVTGTFSGEVAFGATTLGSVGGNDLFVAKWVPGTSTWAWAVAAGGTGADGSTGIAVSGPAVYVTGTVYNNSADANAVRFGSTALAGASTVASEDVLVARYTDNGTAVTFNWARAGGGTGLDKGTGIAVSGPAVYLTGSITNTTTDANAVRFGTTAVAGASGTSGEDVLVARYTDNTSSAALNWARVGGGTGADVGAGIAVSGPAVYVSGTVYNNSADANAVRFGSTTLAGASATASNDVLLARYTDNTTSAALSWATVGGGVGADQGAGIAASGNALYLTGSFSNNAADANAVRFGGAALPGFGTNAYYSDILVARYTDNTSSVALNWAQAGGGEQFDKGTSIAVSGTAVYVTGAVVNDGSKPIRFGETPAYGGTAYSQDVVVARYTDNTSAGVFEWATFGGGNNNDLGASLALSGNFVYVGGFVTPAATFSNLTITNPASTSVNFLGALDITKPHIGWVSPASGVAGTTVTLSNYLLSGASNLVVNGVSTPIVANTASTISFVLPAGAGPTNLITASTAAGPVSTTAFTALLSPLSLNPGVNARSAPLTNSSVALTFSEPITATPPGSAIHVFSAQAGGRKAGSVTLSGSTLSFAAAANTPTTSFKPGEVVRVTLPNGVQNAGGLPASKRVYQFTTGTAGTGGGNFQAPATNAEPGVGAAPSSVATADVDGDGDLDVLTTNSTTQVVTVRLNNGSGVFAPPATGATVGVGYNSASVVTGDVDGDGDLDLLTANSDNNTISVRLNNGAGGFAAPASNSEVYVGSGPRSVALGDVDGDGDLDLAASNYYGNTVSVRFNNGSGIFNGPSNTDLYLGYYLQETTLGDIDGDGDLDLLVVGSNDQAVFVCLNNGAGIFSSSGQRVYVGTTPTGLAVGDVDADGDLDLLTANSGSNNVSVRLNAGNGYFVGPATNATLSVGNSPRHVALGDVDADGDLDLLTTNFAGNTVSVHVNDGSANFTVPAVSASISVGTSPVMTALGDIDGDGDLDVLTANSGSSAVSVRLNQAMPLSVTALSSSAELAGMPITIRGTGFAPGSSVRIGGVPAVGVVVNSSTSITATVPASLPAGSSPVVVTTGAASSTSTTALTVLKLYDGTTSTCPTTTAYTATGDGQWHYLLADNGQVVAALQDTRAALGTVQVNFQVTGPASPVRADGRGNKYLDRNFRLTASGGSFPGQTINMRFFGLTSEMSRLQAADAATTYASLRVTQYSGANEDCRLDNNDFGRGEFRSLPASASTPGNDVPWFMAQVAVPDHFSEFFLTNSATPLPVELTAFTARQRPDGIALTWRTASEKNSARFEVERSTDGQTFARIGTVGAQGTTASPTAYDFLDAEYPRPAAVLYYRLRQFDHDGSSSLSPVRTVQPASGSAQQLYPNPAHSAVTVTGIRSAAPVEVLDALGRQVASARADADGRALLTLPAGLPAGVYVVRSSGLTQRLVVE
ncbi:FG-GAP-like repeat-containing protein [Hymenobacter metallicola]|uniref:SbsA Ig-like domain-containing protein n=1 Tax=Hymenobacter metallicola TaxID=2563114 RepID=A0A4Z0QHQ8_9BACT|nr:FG-GAP-like repeat-containing protein [Hymenobacter metallicola]TGE28783.1 hypothetical protein E5K02_04780 [Hymenobacter metallicola]